MNRQNVGQKAAKFDDLTMRDDDCRKKDGRLTTFSKRALVLVKRKRMGSVKGLHKMSNNAEQMVKQIYLVNYRVGVVHVKWKYKSVFHTLR